MLRFKITDVGAFDLVEFDENDPLNNGSIPASVTINQETIEIRLGTNGDAASKTGSQAAQLRAIANILDGTTGTVIAAASASQSGVWNINNISGTVTLPTGASTLAGQNTTNTRLGTNGDSASKTGSNAAQLRAIADILDGTTLGIGSLNSGVKTVSATGTPEPLVASTTYVNSVLIQAGKARSANASSVWVGFSVTNDAQPIELLPGDAISFEAPPGKRIDISGIYIDVTTANDGVRFFTVL